MINTSLQFVRNILNQYLGSRFGLDESMVVLNSPVAADGSIPGKNANKVLLSLINLERSAAKAPISFGYKAATAKPADDIKTGNYTLYVLASTNFDDYEESLKFLDAVVVFFSVNSVLDMTTNSEMPSAISKMEVTLEPADGVHMRSIWLALGARYQPSVIYKVIASTINQNDTVVPVIARQPE